MPSVLISPYTFPDPYILFPSAKSTLELWYLHAVLQALRKNSGLPQKLYWNKVTQIAMSDCFAFNLNTRVIHSKCSREIFPCSAPSYFPLSSSSRLPQVISSLLLMEIPSDPNLLPDEFNLLHVSIIQAFNPIYGGLGRTGRSKCMEISGITAVCSKPTPKCVKLSSLLTLGAQRLFNILVFLPELEPMLRTF